jgi:iron complex outermembrane receptor protein
MNGRDVRTGIDGRRALAAALCAGACAAPAYAAAQTAPAPTAPVPAASAPSASATAPAKAAAKPAKPRKPAPQPDQDTEVSEVVVSSAPTQYQNLPGAVVGDITPDLELGPADIQSYGVSSVTELLDELAPQTQSDQGRSSGAPVVLLNGRRISGFNEVQNIPTEAILRVDILPEEVALKYGFTADQKVVNIVLRRRFRAVTAELTGGGPTEGGQETGAAEGDLFRVRGDNRINLDVQYQGSSDLDYAARGLSGSPSGAPAAVTTANVPTPGDLSKFRDLSPATQSLTANAVISRTLPAGFSGTVNATLGTTGSQSMQGLPTLNLTVPGTNPFAPGGVATAYDRYVTGLGPLEQSVTGWTAHLGGTLNKDVGKWRLSFTTAYDHADSLTASSAGVDASPLQGLLNANSTSFNPFVAIPNAMLAINPQTEARSLSDSGNAQFLANGPVIKGPAGALFASLKIGDTESGFSAYTQRMGLAQSIGLSRNDFNAQANFDLPLTSRRNHFLGMFGELSVNLHTAVDQLSDFGTLRSLGYGLNWQPISEVRLIVSNTRDQAAPTVQQIGNPTVLTPGVRLYDYATGQTVDVTTVTGANPSLTSDHRDVFKVGLTLKPISSQDLTITANYIDSHINNPIQTFPAATAQIEAAFADRFIRDADGELVEENLTPVNFAYQERRDIRWGINYSRPIGRQPPPRPPGGRFGDGNGDGRPRRPRAQGQAPANGAAPAQPAAPADPAQVTLIPGAGGPPAATAGANGQQAQAGPTDGGPGQGLRQRGAGGGGGGGGGGGRGGGRGFGGGGPSGAAAGRFQVAVYHTIYFTDQYLVRPGGPLLDLLNGSPSGSSGGQPVHQVQVQMGYTLNGWGARASASWVSGTTVEGGAASPSGNLTFSDLATLNLRLFANLGQMRDVVRRHPWLRGSRVTLNLVNLFDARQQVRDAAGLTPLSYEPAYLNPAGRTVSLSLRKLFF